MRELQRKYIYLPFALISVLIFLLLRKQPWEYIMLFTIGLFFGSSLKNKLKLIVIISLIFYLIATIFDPILKPILDLAFKVNTVPFSTSINVNTLLLLLFWIGFYLGGKDIGIKKQ